MQTITLRAHVGKDGILHLDVPVALQDADLEITLTIQPSPPTQVTTSEELGWSPGFFDRTFGAWQGEPLVRESQGEYPLRDELL